MAGVNRALKNYESKRTFSITESVSDGDIPCVFISYQRSDEKYASDIADYITSFNLDVYFDLSDQDLKLVNQRSNPHKVTDAIRKGLNRSDYMIVIVSPNTYKSAWVPFEVGFAYDKKKDKMKILRHKGISKSAMPAYLQVKEILQGINSLNNFLRSTKQGYPIYENKLEKGGRVKTFSEYRSNALNQYLDNE